MNTFLFDSIIFGPMKSRRLGSSLGINLLPTTSKLCNFNCIYCECGWTYNNKNTNKQLPEPKQIKESLTKKIQILLGRNEKIDHITFAGNGEPTLHPKFHQIISDTISIKNSMLPNSKVSVLSNGTMLHKKEIKEALLKVDNCILKLDAGTEFFFQKINQPLGKITIQHVKKHFSYLKGKITIQTLFFKGIHNGIFIDNTSPKELNLWISHILELQPKHVMLYSLDRPTPANNLTPIPIQNIIKTDLQLFIIQRYI